MPMQALSPRESDCRPQGAERAAVEDPGCNLAFHLRTSSASRVPATTAWAGGDSARSKRNEHLGDRCRHAIKSLPACCQDLPGTGLERLVVKHSREAQKVESADRIRRRLGAVVIFLHPHGNQRVAGRAAEIAASLARPGKGRPGAPATPVPISTNRCPNRLGKGRASLESGTRNLPRSRRYCRARLASFARDRPALSDCSAENSRLSERLRGSGARGARRHLWRTPKSSRPFQAVRILSSRCGRGRFARCSKSTARLVARDFETVSSAMRSIFAVVVIILSFQQNIFAPEFTVRIAARRRIPGLFDAVMAAENARLIRAEGIDNLLLCSRRKTRLPRALAGRGTAGCRRLQRRKSRLPGASCPSKT